MSLNIANIQEILQAIPDIEILKKTREESSEIIRKTSQNCPECQFKFPLITTLTKHVLREHPGFFEEFEKVCLQWNILPEDALSPADFLETKVRIPVCEQCGKTFADEVGYRKHISSHSGDGMVSCPVCKKLVNKYHLPAHRRAHDSKKFKCDICSNTFVVERSLRRHIAEVHEKLGQRKCEYCGKNFSDSTGYKRHLAKHEEDGMIPCQICGKLVNKYLLASHKRTHDPKEYICDLCGKNFGTKRCVERHIVHVHMKGTEEYKNARPIPQTCEICGKVYSDPASARRHLETHSDAEKAPCPICGLLLTKSQFASHKRVHEELPKNFFCERCGKSFISNSSLRKHIKNIHEKVEEAACTVCGKILANKVSYEKHMATHSDEGKLSCDKCGKLVVKHLFAQHNLIHGEKKFHCELCGKSFHQAPGLKQHLMTHDKRTCEVCGKVCTKLSTYEKHLAKHSDSAKIPCTTCNGLFDKREMREHKRTHKKPKKFNCDICGKGFAQNRSRAKHIKKMHEKVEMKQKIEPRPPSFPAVQTQNYSTSAITPASPTNSVPAIPAFTLHSPYFYKQETM